MPLPKKLDEKVRKRLDELINKGTKIGEEIEVARLDYENFTFAPVSIREFEAFVFKSCSLIRMILGDSLRSIELQKQVNKLDRHYDSVEQIVGILVGLKDDYESGFCDDFQEMIIADVSSDYMGQAEELLDEGQSGKFDHVPAAVLCGAVLEDSLRRLCNRQTPPIAITKNNGQKKTLDPLISDLQKARVFNKMKADQLRAWAKIRNSAAHGEFEEFNKQDVESMLKGVKNFLADNL